MMLLRRTARALSTTTKPWFRAAGEGTLILRFGNTIDEATNKKVLRRLDALGEKPRGVTDAVPAYASLAAIIQHGDLEGSRRKMDKRGRGPRGRRRRHTKRCRDPRVV